MIDFFEFTISTSIDVKSMSNGFVVNTLNPHSFVVSKKDPLFKKALISSDFLIPDGVGIVWGVKTLLNRRITKISGFDLFTEFMVDANKYGKRCFFMGSSENVLNKITAKCQLEFPNAIIGVLSPPFKSEFSLKENDEITGVINSFNPDFLFVGMTAPKQEKWLYVNRHKLRFGVAASIGAVFDFYAGTVKRPGQFWIDSGLEWLPRFIKEPRRLWKRNLVSTPLFIYEVLKEKYIKH